MNLKTESSITFYKKFSDSKMRALPQTMLVIWLEVDTKATLIRCFYWQ